MSLFFDNDCIKKEEINSFLIACLLEINMLCILFEKINGVIGILSIGIMLMFFINNGIKNKVNLTKILVYILYSCAFLITFLVYQITQHNIKYFVFFIMFGTIAFIISEARFNKESVYKWIVILALPVVFKLIITQAYIIDYTKKDFYGYLMGITYSILPSYIASILIILNKDVLKNNKKLKILNGILFLLITYMYVQMASRGAIVAVVIFIVGVKVFINEKREVKNIIKIILFGITMSICILFLKEILIMTQYLLLQVSIDIEALDKTIRLLADSSSGITNGRVEMWSLALKDTLASPFFGYGIGSYELKYSIGYVHNIFIQYIYEFGYLTFLFANMIIFSRLKSINKYEEKIFLWFLFCIAIIELLFSSVFWTSPRFWFFLGYILKNITCQFRINTKKLERL